MLHLIFGDDDYLVTEEARALVDKNVPAAERDFGLEIIDGACTIIADALQAIDRTEEALYTTSFFGGGKWVWLRDASFLTGGKPVVSTSAAVTERLARFLEMIKKNPLPEGHVLLITAPAVLKSSLFFKHFKATGSIAEFGGGGKPWEKEKNAFARLDSLLERVGLTMSADVKKQFIAKTGTDTRVMVSELEKLRVYRNAPGAVSSDDVRQITSVAAEAEIWELRDAVGRRSARMVMDAIDSLRGESGAGIPISSMLIRQMADLLIVRESLDRGWANGQGWSLPPEGRALAESLQSNVFQAAPFIHKKNVEQAANYTLQELRAGRHYALELREKLVSGSVDEWVLLETTLMRIIGAGRRKKTAKRR